MMKNLQTTFIACVCAVVAAALLSWWLTFDAAPKVEKHVPGMDDPLGWRAEDKKEQAERVIDFGEIHETFPAKAAAIAGNWPVFRGPRLDNTFHEEIELADSFPEEGPPLVWQLEVGQGYGGGAVHGGRVFILDYMENIGDVLRCFSLADGSEIWRAGYGIYIPSNHGVTRTVPAVTDKYVVSFGPMGHVMCARTDTGEVLWGLDLMKHYGTRDLSKMWYAGQCPLIEDGKAIIAPAGSNTLMMAVACESGEILWTAPNEREWRMSHSSITPMTVEGIRTYVYAACDGVAGVAAEGPDAGAVLWWTEDWGTSVVMPSPVILAGNRVFVTSGYDGGCGLLRVSNSGGGLSVETVYTFSGRSRSRNCFSCYQQTPILFDNHLFGIQSNEARENRMEFCCVDPEKDGGEIVWASGDDTVFTAPRTKQAWGPYLLADGKFYVFGDAGNMAVFEANTQECVKLGEWQVVRHGHEVWGPLSIAGGYLLVRDINRLMCFDLRE